MDKKVAAVLRESVEIGIEAAALCEKVAADQTAIADKAPLVADTLIENGLVDSMHKNSTVEMLHDPGSTLDILAKVAVLVRQPRAMGGGVAKSAAEEIDPQNPPEKESDRVFAEKLLSASV